MTMVFIIIGVIVIGGAWLYNSLVQYRNRVQNAWSQIEVQLKRRHDLIPNLLETVKGYMNHERETLEGIAKARSSAMNAVGIAAKSAAEATLSDFMTRFLAVTENYPDLKASQNFRDLQEELSSTENRIAFARQAYNDAVLALNNSIDMFPSNMIAGLCNVKKGEYFIIQNQSEREVPDIKFG